MNQYQKFILKLLIKKKVHQIPPQSILIFLQNIFIMRSLQSYILINILILTFQLKNSIIIYQELNNMGRVRTKTIKRGAKILLEKYYQKLTNDFHINKKILSEVGQVPTKKLRNKIAGFATHLMKRIQKGPVKGISLKVQEEQRQRRLDWVPTTSEISIEKVEIDAETLEMLSRRFGDDFVSGIRNNLKDKQVEAPKKDHKGDRKRKERRENVDGDKKNKQERVKRQPKQPRQPREPRQQKQGQKQSRPQRREPRPDRKQKAVKKQ